MVLTFDSWLWTLNWKSIFLCICFAFTHFHMEVDTVYRVLLCAPMCSYVRSYASSASMQPINSLSSCCLIFPACDCGPPASSPSSQFSATPDSQASKVPQIWAEKPRSSVGRGARGPISYFEERLLPSTYPGSVVCWCYQLGGWVWGLHGSIYPQCLLHCVVGVETLLITSLISLICSRRRNLEKYSIYKATNPSAREDSTQLEVAQIIFSSSVKMTR